VKREGGEEEKRRQRGKRGREEKKDKTGSGGKICESEKHKLYKEYK
jgi:hypothetical protein